MNNEKRAKSKPCKHSMKTETVQCSQLMENGFVFLLGAKWTLFLPNSFHLGHFQPMIHRSTDHNRRKFGDYMVCVLRVWSCLCILFKNSCFNVIVTLGYQWRDDEVRDGYTSYTWITVKSHYFILITFVLFNV